MTATPESMLDVPEWAKPEAFPKAPGGWGWVDLKRRHHPCATLEVLVQAIQNDRAAELSLVWTPQGEWMVLPEEIPELGESLRTARSQWASDDLAESFHRLRWFGIILLGCVGLALYRGFALAAEMATQAGTDVDLWVRLKFGLRAILASGNSGIALLMFVIFAFIPWYQARKRRSELSTWSDSGNAASVPTLRIDTWLDCQKAPVTKVLLALIGCVTVAQLLAPSHGEARGSWFAIFQNWGGISQAGLVKSSYFQGEWWRLFTAPLMHGNIVHLLMNGSAMLYLGKRLEVLARWPHLVLVFLFSASAGGIASAHLVTATSVGASGGLMGWLGFLLVFETLHHELVPLRSRKRLAAGVFVTALIGLVGYRFIDNAAHVGGLLAGMTYALVVFPRSSSGKRPSSTLLDRLAGSAALLAIVLAAAAAFFKILES